MKNNNNNNNQSDSKIFCYSSGRLNYECLTSLRRFSFSVMALCSCEVWIQQFKFKIKLYKRNKLNIFALFCVTI